MTTISEPEKALIEQAAALLVGVAQAEDVSSGVALLCLAASQRLALLSSHDTLATSEPETATQAITTALRTLGELPSDVFALTDILDAASDARRALELIS